MITRLNPIDRKNALLDAAIALSKKHGYTRVTYRQIAEAAGVSRPTVSRYFDSRQEFQSLVLWEAVQREVPEIIAQALSLKDPALAAIPDALRQQACKSL